MSRKQYLVVLTNAVEGRDDELNEWYTGRHLDDVLALEGFVAAQRFEFTPSRMSQDAPYRYLAIYEVEEGDLERAESALLAARAQREVDLREGREPAMPLSPALAEERMTWWFTPITERVEAP